MTTRPEATHAPTRVLPLEIHVTCVRCNPDLTRPAVCGTQLRGIWWPGKPTVTCVVCAGMERCPGCGGRLAHGEMRR